MRRADLAAFLNTIPRPVSPKPELEQVRTPPEVAADFLWLAHEDGAIAGRRVVDLGCGTGIFAWGAAFLGAAHVVGVEIDERQLELAQEVRPPVMRPPVVAPTWLARDVANWAPWADHDQPDVASGIDTVIMNPPFGAQRENRNADRAFYACALAAVSRTGAGGTVWFLGQPRTERFLEAMAEKAGATIERVGSWTYPLEAFYEHHTQTARRFAVAGYRMAVPL